MHISGRKCDPVKHSRSKLNLVNTQYFYEVNHYVELNFKFQQSLWDVELVMKNITFVAYVIINFEWLYFIIFYLTFIPILLLLNTTIRLQITKLCKYMDFNKYKIYKMVPDFAKKIQRFYGNILFKKKLTQLI